MILQALYRYHQLLLKREGDTMPGPEYSSADVSFEIQLNENGQLVSVIPYDNEKGKIERRKYIVPKQEKRASSIKPYFLCDKAEYLFGGVISMRDACRDAMKNLWNGVLEGATEDCLEINALFGFLSSESIELEEQLHRLVSSDLMKSLQSGGLCVLKYAPTGAFFHQNRIIQHAWECYFNKNNVSDAATEAKLMCLVTGEQVPFKQIARLHPNIKNIVGAQSAGAAMVSFNIESFRSYGHEQSFNAPTSIKAADAYTYVLNRLLADPDHKARMNDTTVVFWTESSSSKEEDWLASLFQDYQENDQNLQSDEENVRARVKSVVSRIRQGHTFRDTFQDLNPDTNFYVLGLSPNQARLSVRFWYTGTLGELGERVWNHYRDLSIIGLDRSPSIRELLREIAVGHEWSNIPPNMEGQMLRSVLLGLPYSRAIFAQLMNRIRAESDDPKKGQYKIGSKRAAMIKAYLIRHYQQSKNILGGEIAMELNEQTQSVPYHLGRLFACLEKAQTSALGQGINATIRDRFWGAASATPANVFPRLLSLAQHHIAKDEEWGRVNDQRIQEVMNALPAQFPKRLTLEEQGMFALGYYHQRQALYTKKSDN